MKKKVLACLLGCTVASGSVYAEQLDLSLPTSDPYQPLLAAGDMGSVNDAESEARVFAVDNDRYEEPWLTGSKAHQYMGLGALALVALAAVSPKEEDSIHEYFATGATVLAAGAATTGFVYHWDDFHFEDGITDPDNLHMMLGLLGTIAMVAAISEAPEAGHAGPGILGGVAMGAAVKITW